MTTPINLNKARKDQSKARKKADTDANAVKHGRTKAQRLLEATQSDKLRAHLDAHKFDE
ncbi:MAG: DUF4169 family protein [Paracoccaceae bacterium]|jgi:hypothetical protein|nr:DUF4169 family protein [Paracoccaceae bacterium]MDG1801901.1 DUF4169 family protein [Paracoccaceae bacterium]